MRESLIYIKAKAWFTLNGYTAIAGQPPNGSDNIPVVEIKSGGNSAKGSGGSYKPDLLVCNESHFWIVECKPKFCRLDELKLERVLSDRDRIGLLFRELLQRKLFEKANLQASYPDAEILASKIRLCLANSAVVSPRTVVYNLSLESSSDQAVMIAPRRFE